MKKILQRVSKVVMACLLFGMCVLFSGCFLIEKISPYTRPRFYHFEGTWVCDTEEFKIALETKGRTEHDLLTILTLNGEEMEVSIVIGGAGAPSAIWIYKGRDIYEIGQLPEPITEEEYDEREALKAPFIVEQFMFKIDFDSRYFKKAERYVTWDNIM